MAPAQLWTLELARAAGFWETQSLFQAPRSPRANFLDHVESFSFPQVKVSAKRNWEWYFTKSPSPMPLLLKKVTHITQKPGKDERSWRQDFPTAVSKNSSGIKAAITVWINVHNWNGRLRKKHGKFMFLEYKNCWFGWRRLMPILLLFISITNFQKFWITCFTLRHNIYTSFLPWWANRISRSNYMS